MGVSKDLFLMMRESEIETTNFAPTKKEIETQTKEFVKNLIDSGEHEKKELLAQAVRVNASVGVVLSELKESLGTEDFNAFGVTGKYIQGYDKANFKDDPIYKELESKLKEREELLKVALKSKETIYDSEGIEVPRVSTTPTKGSLKLTF